MGRRGATCFPQYVPGGSRALTMAMIRDAFHDTDFSVPTVNIQPEGDVTLVNLPTFFEVTVPGGPASARTRSTPPIRPACSATTSRYDPG